MRANRYTFNISVLPGLLIALAGALLSGCQPTVRPQAKPVITPDQPKADRPARPVHPPNPNTVWPPRAAWVVRRVYESPQQIADLMENCHQAGFNNILFQIRGNGTLFIPSSIEPLADEFAGNDRGFDQLQVACTEAHRRGMALHAWVNVMPAWRGSRPPADPRQLYNAHPDWFLKDQKGRRQPLNDFYVSLNPALPEVRKYLVNLFHDICARYPIDGLHLDYIRFPLDKAPRGADYPRDARSLQLYRTATGKKPDQDRNAWTRWRRQQVTQLVSDIRRMLRRAKPQARLTVACSPDLQTARNTYFQDGPSWLRQNLVDAAFVMNYTADPATFRKRQETWLRAAPGKMVVPGLGVYKHQTSATTLEQLRYAESWRRGFALFSTNALFGPDAGQPPRIDAIQPTLTAMAQRADTRRKTTQARQIVP